MPANYRDPKPIRSYGIEWRVTPCSFVPNASDTTAAPIANTTVGPISVARTSTGLYTVTLTGGGAPRAIIQHSYEAPAGLRGQFWQQLSAVNDTVGTFVLWNMNVGTTTLVNFTATADQVVHLTVFQQASSYTR
jgi:hypothetical protein